MLFHQTTLPDVLHIEPEFKEDERGYFGRIFCEEEFKKQGIPFRVRQSNRGFNKAKGTVRGMHFQRSPFWEDKVMTCISGAIYIIVVDLRPESQTFKQWTAVELSAERRNMLFVPKGCANGSQTLTDNCEVLYFMSEFYVAEAAGGINYADPQFNFIWPLGAPSSISQKDQALPYFDKNLL